MQKLTSQDLWLHCLGNGVYQGAVLHIYWTQEPSLNIMWKAFVLFCPLSSNSKFPTMAKFAYQTVQCFYWWQAREWNCSLNSPRHCPFSDFRSRTSWPGFTYEWYFTCCCWQPLPTWGWHVGYIKDLPQSQLLYERVIHEGRDKGLAPLLPPTSSIKECISIWKAQSANIVTDTTVTCHLLNQPWELFSMFAWCLISFLFVCLFVSLTAVFGTVFQGTLRKNQFFRRLGM